MRLMVIVLLGFLAACPDDAYECGPMLCERGEQYCEVIPALGLAAYNCRELPTECKGVDTTCDCMVAKACGDLCEQPGGAATATITCDDTQE